MESTLQFFLFVQFIAVFAKFRYNTHPTPSLSVATLYVPTVNPLMKTCFLRPDPGPCRADMKMYYFDPSLNNCIPFKWGGCQGNGNRFETRDICKETCYMPPDMQPSPPRYCMLSFDYGFCFGALKRWYYDKNWKVCKETIYSGCGGNKNNFYKFEQCDTICRLGNRPIPKPTTKKKHTDIRKIIIVNPPYATSPKTVKIYDTTKS